MAESNADRHNSRYIVASIYTQARGNSIARFVSVASRASLHRVQVPAQFIEALLTGKSSAQQLRFDIEFESSPVNGQITVSDVIAVPLESYEGAEPVPTSIGAFFCEVEPFNFDAKVWFDSHRLRHRYSTTDLRTQLYYACIDILKVREDLPDNSDIFRVEAALHPSDVYLFDESISDDQWLLRATLCTSYFLNFEAPRKKVLLQIRSEVQRNNIARLRRALQTADAAAFFRSSGSDEAGRAQEEYAEPTELGPYQLSKRHPTYGAGCAGHREVSDASDLECARRELTEECGGARHPFVASFRQARLRRNSRALVGTAQELELPYIIFKEPNSFDVRKKYMVRLCDELSHLARSLESNSLFLTTDFPCKASSWTPHLQQLLDQADIDPQAFYESHSSGQLKFNKSSPISLTLKSNSDFIEAGGAWFLSRIKLEEPGLVAREDNADELVDAAAALAIQEEAAPGPVGGGWAARPAQGAGAVGGRWGGGAVRAAAGGGRDGRGGGGGGGVDRPGDGGGRGRVGTGDSGRGGGGGGGRGGRGGRGGIAPCRNWLATGACTYGNGCNFSHQ